MVRCHIKHGGTIACFCCLLQHLHTISYRILFGSQLSFYVHIRSQSEIVGFKFDVVKMKRIQTDAYCENTVATHWLMNSGSNSLTCKVIKQRIFTEMRHSIWNWSYQTDWISKLFGMRFNCDGQKSLAIFVANINCIIKLIMRNKFRDKIHKYTLNTTHFW